MVEKQSSMAPKFFKTPKAFRKWLETNHEKKNELWVGYYKKDTGKASITWPESVEQALCFGWIDGIRKKCDEESYMIRFTPRRKGSIWSATNIRFVEKLTKEGLMQPAGIEAYKNKKEDKSSIYSFEQKKEDIKLPPAFEKEFKKNKKAWKTFQAMAPYYQRSAIWWVISAKREDTQKKRLKILISDSEAGVKVKPLRNGAS